MLVTLLLDPRKPWAHLRERAVEAERQGFDAVRLTDAPGEKECFTVIGALAGAVPRIGLQLVVDDERGRHPAVVAKLATTVDRLCEGRLLLGLTGCDESRITEAADIIKALTTNERSNFRGRFYTLRDAPLDPKPLQLPFPLMLVNGLPSTAAQWADHWSIEGPDVETQLEALDDACRHIGRSRSEIKVSVMADDPPRHGDEWVVPEARALALARPSSENSARASSNRAR